MLVGFRVFGGYGGGLCKRFCQGFGRGVGMWGVGYRVDGLGFRGFRV